MRLVSALVLFLAVLSASAADIMVKEEPVPPDSFARVWIALDKGQSVLWDVYPEPVTVEEFQKDGRSWLVFSGPRGTKYKVVATVQYIKDGGIVSERQRKTVAFAGEAPEPLPGPDPAPTPDVDGATLLSALKAVFKTETADDKALVPALRDLYARYAVDSEVAKYTTFGALETAMRATAGEYKVTGKLTKTQTVLAEYLTRRLPGREAGWENVVISDKDRKATREAFAMVSNALGKLK